ncbi:DUF1302 domain-containing protein [Massilia sp. H-1]|nr:DUF1302 domain-containing protein [Massilia sp. H-1]
MIRPHGVRHRLSRRLILSALGGALVLAWMGDAFALETRISGRLMYGAAFRMEDPNPELMVAYNAAAVGLTGLANSGQNTDDANLNFRRGDATTRAARLLRSGAGRGRVQRAAAGQGLAGFRADRPSPPMGQQRQRVCCRGRPLSDEGGARLTRFSGVALGDAYLQYAGKVSDAKLVTRFGQQALPWGERAAFAGGLSAVNPVDQPAMRRAGCRAAGVARAHADAVRARRAQSRAGDRRLLYHHLPSLRARHVRHVLGLGRLSHAMVATAPLLRRHGRQRPHAFAKRRFSQALAQPPGRQRRAVRRLSLTFKALASEFGVYHALHQSSADARAAQIDPRRARPSSRATRMARTSSSSSATRTMSASPPPPWCTSGAPRR